MIEEYRNPILDAALAYSKKGWKIFPVRGRTDPERAKHPIPGLRWHDESTDDAEIIKSWFRDPDLGIGIDCGKSHLVMLDGDRPEKIPPELITALDGGWKIQGDPDRSNWVFSMNGTVYGNSVGGWMAGEVRGDGGYFVAPPSFHPKGGEYKSLTEVDDAGWVLPPRIAAFLDEKGEVTSTGITATLDMGPVCPTMKRVLQKHLRILDQALATGEGRHEAMRDATFALAGTYSRGHTGSATAVSGIRDTYRKGLGEQAFRERQGASEFERAVEQALEKHGGPKEVCNGRCDQAEFLEEAKEYRARIVMGREVGMEKMDWLVPGLLPATGFAMVVGREGIGKSVAMARVLAMLTSGGFGTPPVKIALGAIEDGLAEVWKPRMHLCDADPDMYGFVRVDRETGGMPDFSNAGFMDGLAEQMKDLEFGVLYLDVLLDAVDANAQTNDYNSMKRSLKRINEWGEKHKILVIAIWHMGKSAAGGNAKDATIGSTALLSAPRVVISMVEDVEAENGRIVFAPTKANQIPKGSPGWEFTISDETYVTKDGETGHVGIASIPTPVPDGRNLVNELHAKAVKGKTEEIDERSLVSVGMAAAIAQFMDEHPDGARSSEGKQMLTAHLGREPNKRTLTSALEKAGVRIEKGFGNDVWWRRG